MGNKREREGATKKGSNEDRVNGTQRKNEVIRRFFNGPCGKIYSK